MFIFVYTHTYIYIITYGKITQISASLKFCIVWRCFCFSLHFLLSTLTPTLEIPFSLAHSWFSFRLYPKKSLILLLWVELALLISILVSLVLSLITLVFSPKIFFLFLISAYQRMLAICSLVPLPFLVCLFFFFLSFSDPLQ